MPATDSASRVRPKLCNTRRMTLILTFLTRPRAVAAGAAAALVALAAALPVPTAAASRTMAQILTEAPSADWRKPDPENTLYLELPSGRVVIELAPRFAPLHIANIKKLV